MKSGLTKFSISLIILLLGTVFTRAQEVVPAIKVKVVLPQEFAFAIDTFYHKPWNLAYDDGIPSTHLSLDRNKAISIPFYLLQGTRIDSLSFLHSLTNQFLKPIYIRDSLYILDLPAQGEACDIFIYNETSIVHRIGLHFPERKLIRINLVPCYQFNTDTALLRNYLNEVFRPANLQFQIQLASPYKYPQLPSDQLFSNPSTEHNRYTRQMRAFRDAYFETEKNAQKDSYTVFLIKGFVNPDLKGFMARNKALAFVRCDEDLVHTIARQLGYGLGMLTSSWQGVGPPVRSTQNLMDLSGGTQLVHWQWDQLIQSAESYSFYDEDEDLMTNNGMVAYYFWEEAEDGWIDVDPSNPLKAIKRPFKKNIRSYILNIEDYFFITLFKAGPYFICLWHLLSLLVLFIIQRIIRRRIRIAKQSDRISLIRSVILRQLNTLSMILLFYALFLFINNQIKHYEVRSGHISIFNSLSYEEVKENLLSNEHLDQKEEDDLTSELVIKRDSVWFVKQRERVLYFDVKLNDNTKKAQMRLASDNDSLILPDIDFAEFAQSHYTVLTFYQSNGKRIKQQVFNHLGFDITKKLQAEDAAKRILLFVNGYRPTSLGRTFEENFADIRNKGLEHPDSRNLIFNFDRYDYWNPWMRIDEQFQKRINPSDTYYADGHFSVSTSNHRSLISFTTNSMNYPKRCINPYKHHCFLAQKETTGFFGRKKEVSTFELLAVDANKKGFRKRREKGSIAGKNLLMMLNERPSRSHNDTLYIVAHSMGYAYALGMLDELRGKINFGGFYIIAPENAKSGEVDPEEWEEIWQYGSNLFGKNPDPPCLQDGVAPQSRVKGLNANSTVFIPESFYRRKGYFDSHFIGYYTWIFDIPEGESGRIRQR